MTFYKPAIVVAVALSLIVAGVAFAGLGPAASFVDSDGDGAYDWSDNCPDDANAEQADFDGDSAGDECDDDIDDDGVLNELDDCPSTVDADDFDDKGCSANQRDGDGDGLSDAIDDCLSTQVDALVDESGCSEADHDGDLDGVPDASDLCPATPEAESVNPDGCSATERDGDDDGIVDAEDSCLDTTPGEIIDEEGCPPVPLDGDDDGVSDDLDACPTTPTGELVDDIGCSATERDRDGDGLTDADDACPSSPAGEEVATDGCADSEVDPSIRPWWCNSTGTGSGSGQHGMHIDPAYENMTKGMLSWQDCLTLTDQFQAAIAWAMQWPTLGDAEAAGFAMSVDYVAGMGTHHVVYANFTFDDDFDPYDPEFLGTRMDDVFEFERPEFLMYAGSTDDAELVGFAWYVKTNSTSPPEGFAGDNDWWHRHQALCFYNATLQVIGEDITDEECNLYQGTNVHLGDYWMAHAWIIEPWLQQHDVFANHHPCLKDDGPETDTSDSCWMAAMHGGAGHDS